MSEVLRIREMCDDERPREKMMKKGVKSLSYAELLAIMIRTGDKNNNAVTLSSKVLTLSKHGVRGLTDLSLDELCSIDGIGPSKATIIKAALELGVRVSQYLPIGLKSITHGMYIPTIWRSLGTSKKKFLRLYY